jgi:DNA-binding beta-propeller fold protein YncE
MKMWPWALGWSLFFAGCGEGSSQGTGLHGVEVDLDCATSGHICTLAGTGQRGFTESGAPALETHLFLPTDASLDETGRLLVVDYNNMLLRRLEDDGTLSTVVGTGRHAYAFDGIDALETPIENPVALAVASQGVYYLMEQHGSRVLRFDRATGWLDVYAGDSDNPGYEGWAGDGGPARDATMSQSVGLALADDGTLYIADTRNHRIRYVEPLTEIMQTLAGSGERGLLDGIGLEAQFNEPHHLAWSNGLLYVADAGNHVVRRIDLDTGEVRVFAGTGTAGSSGDGGLAVEATLHTPQGVGVGADGVLYIADTENHVVRRVDPEGRIDTVIGSMGVPGYEGDGGPVSGALLHWPVNVSVLDDGRILIADTINSVIRVVVP